MVIADQISLENASLTQYHKNVVLQRVAVPKCVRLPLMQIVQ